MDSRLVRRWIIPLIALLLSGCSSSKHSAWQGPTSVQPVAYEPWGYHDLPGLTVKTKHYAIHSTIENKEFLDRLAQVMEGAYTQYQKVAPGVRTSDRPMDCFVFANRNEWAAFTREHTGEDSKVYLKINKGGYTVRDWHLRLVLGRMWGDEPVAYRSWAVHSKPGPAERELWRRLDVDLAETTLELYVGGLAAGMEPA